MVRTGISHLNTGVHSALSDSSEEVSVALFVIYMVGVAAYSVLPFYTYKYCQPLSLSVYRTQSSCASFFLSTSFISI